MMRHQKLLLDDSLNSASGVDLHANTVDSCFESKGQENGSNHQHYSSAHPTPTQNQPLIKKKRSLPGNPGSKSTKSSNLVHGLIFIIFKKNEKLSVFLYLEMKNIGLKIVNYVY